jgi:hypothetical protein
MKDITFTFIIVWDDIDSIFVCTIAERRECTGHGKNRIEAMKMCLD